MEQNHFITVARLAQIKTNKISCFVVNGVSIAICKVKQEYFAVHNKCTHAEATFAKARLRSHKLLCPLHGAIFDVRDGRVLSAPAVQALQTYEVKIEGDEIKVKLATENSA